MEWIKGKREELFQTWWLLHSEGEDEATNLVGRILMTWWM